MDIEWLLTRHPDLDEDFMVELAKVETEAIKRRLTGKRRRRRRSG